MPNDSKHIHLSFYRPIQYFMWPIHLSYCIFMYKVEHFYVEFQHYIHYCAHDFHNDSFTFLFPYISWEIFTGKGDTKQVSQDLVCTFPYWCIRKAGFGMTFPSLMNMETAHLYLHHHHHNNNYYYYLFFFPLVHDCGLMRGASISWRG